MEEQDVVGCGDRRRSPRAGRRRAWRTGGATTGPPVDPVVVDLGQRPDLPRVAEQLLEPRQALRVVRQRESRTLAARASACAARSLATRLRVDRHRVLDPLGDLGEQQARLLDPRRQRQVVVHLAEMAVFGKEGVAGVHERAAASGATQAPSRVTPWLADSALDAIRCPATIAARRSSSRSTSWSSWTPPPISPSASPGAAFVTTDSYRSARSSRTWYGPRIA